MSLHVLGAFWLFIDCAVPLLSLLPVISGLMAVPLKNPWDPRLRTGLEGLLSSIPLGLDLLYREECWPPPPALPRLMPEVLLLSFTSIHGSGVASLCRESACSRRFVSPQLTDTPWLTFLNVFIEKDQGFIHTRLQKENLGISTERRQ